jgi:hypothetical protein
MTAGVASLELLSIRMLLAAGGCIGNTRHLCATDCVYSCG